MPECKLALHINLVIFGALAASLRPVIANQLPVGRRQRTVCQVLDIDTTFSNLVIIFSVRAWQCFAI